MSGLAQALAAELRAALRDPDVAGELAQLLRPVVQEAAAAALAAQEADKMLTYREAAAYLGRSYGALKQAVTTDPSLARLVKKKGRVTRFRRADLDRWLAERGPGPRRRRRAPAPAQQAAAG